jgi:hypothetical protein
MVVQTAKLKRRRAGWLEIDLAIAMGILVLTMMPLAYSFSREARLFKASYCRAVAMEIVDGEMEILTRGEWRAFERGTHQYPVTADAARNLPDGEFILTVEAERLRLEWIPELKQRGGTVMREVVLP